jgi:hypothetical protein
MLKKQVVPRPLKKFDKVSSFDGDKHGGFFVEGIIIWMDDNLVRIKCSFSGNEVLVARKTVTHRD